MKNMTVENICKACGGELHGTAPDTEAVCVVLDSRKLEPGGVFIATRGEKVDGHSFIPQVFEKGALAVVCEELPDKEYGPCILVKDSFAALTAIAAFYRTQLDCRIIGVTGSVGKTTTKEQITAVLRKKYKVCATEGNYNNEIGVPLTLLRIREDDDYAVVEMGINHFGEMSRLTAVVHPDMAVITVIGECHLEALGDLDGVLRAKSEIFEGMKEDAPAFLNADDAKLSTVQRKNIIWFGETDHARGGQSAAEAIGRYCGLTDEEIEEALAEFSPLPGRGHVVKCSGFDLIDDCYNANPTSMRYSIDRLCRLAPAGRVAILGDMFELGEKEAELHACVGRYAAECGVEKLIVAGALSKHTAEAYEALSKRSAECYGNTEALLEAVSDRDFSGQIVLIKASHGMHFERIVEKLEERGK